MSNPLRFLLSGPGLIGAQHARLIGERSDSVLAAVVAPKTGENAEFADKHQAPLYDEVATALVAERIDAAIVSSPNQFHLDQALACLAAGVPVLVEKPVTDTLADARRLVEAVEAGNVPVLVGHHRTYSPLLSVASAFMASGEFGRLVAVKGSALFYKPAGYFAEGPWRTVKGGGPILINLIHEIGLMRHFCGEIASVVALCANSIRGFEVEDTVSLGFVFENGAMGTFLLSDTAASSKSWEMTSGENPAYPHVPDENCYHFAGTQGSLDFPSMRVRTYGPGEPSWWRDFATRRIAFQRADPLKLQLAHFVDVIRGHARPAVTARDGFMNMAVVEAIGRSATTGKVVSMTEVLEGR